MTPVFMPNRIFVDNVCFLITNKETSRNFSISAPVRLTSRAKLLSQMNPIAGSMSADSRSVEIQASAGSRRGRDGQADVHQVKEGCKEGCRQAGRCKAYPPRRRQPADCEGRRRRRRAGLHRSHARLEK